MFTTRFSDGFIFALLGSVSVSFASAFGGFSRLLSIRCGCKFFCVWQRLIFSILIMVILNISVFFEKYVVKSRFFLIFAYSKCR